MQTSRRLGTTLGAVAIAATGTTVAQTSSGESTFERVRRTGVLRPCPARCRSSARTSLPASGHGQKHRAALEAKLEYIGILFATSEFADCAKAGGLREVSAGLPRALRRRDIDIRVLLPAYPEVISKASDITVVAHLPGRAGIAPCCNGETPLMA